MPKPQRVWTRVKPLSAEDKRAIGARCEALISDVLKPRHLPAIVPTRFNYAIDLLGRWRGDKYSFIVRYRSGFPDNEGEEFETAFARIDHLQEFADDTRFDVMWRRHTGQWWLLHREVSLDEALRLVETDGVLSPPI